LLLPICDAKQHKWSHVFLKRVVRIVGDAS
jgi:hypothetical protein